MSSFTEKIQEKLQETIVPVAMKMNNQPHLSALKDGMTLTIPLTIIGGFFMLLAQPPVPVTMEATNFFYSFLINWKEWATINQESLLVPFNLSIGALSVYIVVAITYELAKHYKIDRLTTSAIALFIFWMTSAPPMTIEEAGLITQMGGLGATGMFYAIIISFITVEVTRFFYEKDIKIRMPEQVPPNVSAPFSALIPAVFLTVVFYITNIFVRNATGDNLGQLIYNLLEPLMSASSSLPSVILLSMLLSLFWFFGIHGNNMLGGIITPITTANLAINAEYYINGVGSPIPFSGAMLTIFGNWMSYPAMVLCFFLFAKSARLKSLRAVAVIPDLFNINEPLTFGVPIVMNVSLALPIMIINILNVTIAYIVMSAGLVNSIYIAVPWTAPGIINLLLATGFDLRSLFLWGILFIANVIILIPFIKMYDTQLLAEEEMENQIQKDKATTSQQTTI